MSTEFEEFQRQFELKDSESAVTRKKHHCPNCKEELHEAYIEQNPFPEIPCPSCGTLIDNSNLEEISILSANQRVEERCEVSLKVTYQSYDNFIIEYTKNVSRGGMFLKTKQRHEIGSHASLLLHVPGLDEPIKIIGEIVRTHFFNVTDENSGVGIKFIELDDTSRQYLIDFIKTQEDCS